MLCELGVAQDWGRGRAKNESRTRCERTIKRLLRLGTKDSEARRGPSTRSIVAVCPCTLLISYLPCREKG